MKPDFTALINYLDRLYEDTSTIRRVARRADFPVGGMKFDLGTHTVWSMLIDYAKLDIDDRLLRLLEVITEEGNIGYKDKYLIGWINGLRQKSLPIDPLPIPETAYREMPSDSNLEKITSYKSTLLPVSFLEKGILCAQAVARVLVNGSAGTGFLIKNNYLVTNKHVIDSIETAENATIQFNFQKNWQGVELVSKDLYLDPRPLGHFITGTTPNDDFTIVKLKTEANSMFGYLELATQRPHVNQFVNIIQHPGGRPKEIALYHNVIMYVDDNIVQYLTDTEPGSSGSPVFNSDWQVVALHYRGGELAEPTTSKKYLRNEGIAIHKIIKALDTLQP